VPIEGNPGTLTMFQRAETSAVDDRLTLIHQSPRQGSNERSVSRPPAAVPSRVIVMIVPARRSDQMASPENVNSPCGSAVSPNQMSVPSVTGRPVLLGAVETHWSFQPRTSAWSTVTTNSIQSPPLPMRRPRKWSVSEDVSPVRMHVAPAAPSPQPSQRSSRTELYSLMINSVDAAASAHGTVEAITAAMTVFIGRCSWVGLVRGLEENTMTPATPKRIPSNCSVRVRNGFRPSTIGSECRSNASFMVRFREPRS
jgi:hypothetical protein